MLESQKNLFSLEEGVSYLNCAYMSPMLKTVEEVGIKGIISKRNPQNVGPEDFFLFTDKVREEFSKLIHNSTPSNVAIIPSVSYGMATAAANLPLREGQEILIIQEQFPSNYYSWARLAREKNLRMRIIEAPVSTGNRVEAWNEAIEQAIGPETGLLALPHVHWADGSKFDLLRFREKLDVYGAFMVVDGTQSVGALPFSVETFRPDVLVCAGYKWLMGPYSMGLAYFSDRMLEGRPIEENWINRFESENFSGLVSYQNEYQAGALRYDVGEKSNFILLPMMYEALKQVNKWTPEGIQEYAGKLFSPFREKFSSKGYQMESGNNTGNHLLGLRNPSIDTAKLTTKLSKNKVSLSLRGQSLRVSIHLWNVEADLERLYELL